MVSEEEHKLFFFWMFCEQVFEVLASFFKPGDFWWGVGGVEPVSQKDNFLVCFFVEEFLNGFYILVYVSDNQGFHVFS